MVAAFVVGCSLDAVDGRALWVLAETQVVDETQEWVSDDAEPWRTECKESKQALQQAVQQLAAMQVQQARTEQQLREAREAAATATAAAAAAGKESEQAKVVSQGAQAAVVPRDSVGGDDSQYRAPRD